MIFQISSYFVRTEIQVVTRGKMTHRTLFQILVELVAIVSMDLSKAFDVIQHDLLLAKLKA